MFHCWLMLIYKENSPLESVPHLSSQAVLHSTSSMIACTITATHLSIISQKSIHIWVAKISVERILCDNLHTLGSVFILVSFT